MNRQRIQLAVPVFNPVGGIRTYLRYCYGALPVNRYRFVVIVPRGASEHSVAADLAHVDAEIHECSGANQHVAIARRLQRVLSSTRIDGIHAHGTTAAVLAACVNAVFRRPLVATLHESFHAAQFSGRFGSLKRSVAEFGLGACDVVQAVSHDALSSLLRVLPGVGRRTRTCVIENGIDIAEFSHEPELSRTEWYADLNLPGTPPFMFGFFGRAMPEKGFPILIDAVERLAHASGTPQFLVLVLASGGYIREYEADTRARGLSRFFHFAGFRPQVLDALKYVGALVMPSLSEAAGILAMEAFVAGCPLIASSCIGLREVCRDSPALQVEPGHGKALAAAMSDMIENHAGYERSADQFVPDACARFDIRVTAERLDALFRSVIAQENA